MLARLLVGCAVIGVTVMRLHHMLGAQCVRSRHRVGCDEVLGDAWSEREQGHGGNSQPSHTSSLYRPA